MPDEKQSAATNAAAVAADAESPDARVKQLEEEKRQLFDQLLRRQADFDNYRKRAERDLNEFRQYAETELVQNLLPVLDAFERALAPPGAQADDDYRRGIDLIYKQLADTLARAGLQPVETVGRAFDPFCHHAVERVETADHPDQQVIAELQRGYKFNQRLLRPALVLVAVAPISRPF